MKSLHAKLISFLQNMYPRYKFLWNYSSDSKPSVVSSHTISRFNTDIHLKWLYLARHSPHVMEENFRCGIISEFFFYILS